MYVCMYVCIVYIYSQIKIKIYNYTVEMYKNTTVIANKSRCTYDTKKNKTHRNKSIKPFSRTDQIRDSLFVSFD